MRADGGGCNGGTYYDVGPGYESGATLSDAGMSYTNTPGSVRSGVSGTSGRSAPGGAYSRHRGQNPELAGGAPPGPQTGPRQAFGRRLSVTKESRSGFLYANPKVHGGELQPIHSTGTKGRTPLKKAGLAEKEYMKQQRRAAGRRGTVGAAAPDM